MLLQYPVAINAVLATALAASMVGLTMLGRRAGARYLAGATEMPGLGPVEGAIFGLFGLLIALTFHGSVERFAHRRALIIEEANATGTAYLRLDLLAEAPRRDLQARFRSYLGHRLEAYAGIAEADTFWDRLKRSEQEGVELWAVAAQACRDPETARFVNVVLPSINEMLDVAQARTAALHTRPPAVLYAFLFLLSLGCAFVIGFAMAKASRPSWTHIAAFALAVSLTIFITLDIDAPRLGLIRVDASDAILRDVLESMR